MNVKPEKDETNRTNKNIALGFTRKFAWTNVFILPTLCPTPYWKGRTTVP